MKTKVYAFDFDGTLTTGDSFLAFIRFAKGPVAMLAGLMLHAPLLLLMKLGACNNGKVKQRLFSYFFKGMSLSRFDDTCRRFADSRRQRLLRPQAMNLLRQAEEEGAIVLVVSASIDRWVAPFFHPATTSKSQGHKPATEVIATQLEVCRGRLTGRFSTPNCHGQEKVRRMLQRLAYRRDRYHIVAFGDSRGDREMLNFADEAYYKPFRS